MAQVSPTREELIDDQTSLPAALFYIDLARRNQPPCLFIYPPWFIPNSFATDQANTSLSPPVAIFLSLQFNLKRALFFNIINFALSLHAIHSALAYPTATF